MKGFISRRLSGDDEMYRTNDRAKVKMIYIPQTVGQREGLKFGCE